VFFPKDYELRYDHITDLGSGGITYTLSDIESRLGSAESSRAGATAPATTARAAAARARSEPVASAHGSDRDELRIPLMEEEIDIQKVSREIGHVRIHKVIKTEEKHFSVPVMREDVVIERVAASSDEPSLPSESMFKEQILDVALHEEDVKVSKHSRLREQMIVRTVAEALQKDASANLRHEECEIEDTRAEHSPGWSAGSEWSLGGYSSPSRH